VWNAECTIDVTFRTVCVAGRVAGSVGGSVAGCVAVCGTPSSSTIGVIFRTVRFVLCVTDVFAERVAECVAECVAGCVAGRVAVWNTEGINHRRHIFHRQVPLLELIRHPACSKALCVQAVCSNFQRFATKDIKCSIPYDSSAVL